MKSLRDHLLDQPLEALGAPEPQVDPAKVPRVLGLTPSGCALAVQARWAKENAPILVLCDSARRLEQMRDDLECLLGEEQVCAFQGWEISPEEWTHPSESTVSSRLELFLKIRRGEPFVLLATWSSLLGRLPRMDALLSRSFVLERGADLDPRGLSEKLLDLGFSPEPMVEEVGEFSVRGGIVDFFPYLGDQPIRVDLMGDGVESIRTFDIFSQRSTGNLERVEILPLGELSWPEENWELGRARIRGEHGQRAADAAIEALRHREGRDGLVWMRPFFLPSGGTLLDLFPERPVVFADGESAARAKLAEARDRLASAWEAHRAAGRPVAPLPELAAETESVAALLEKCRRLDFCTVDFGGGAQWNFRAEEQSRSAGGLADLSGLASELSERGIRVSLLAPNEGQARRLAQLAEGLPVDEILVGQLRSGVVLPEERRAWLTDHQLFNRLARRVRHSKFRRGGEIPDLSQLYPGDWVVHMDHGVGRFVGVQPQRLSSGGSVDMLVVEYADRAMLRLPVEDLFKLEKIAPSDAEPPRMDSLGGRAWNKLKERARRRAAEVARDLVELYAARQSSPGFAFPPDTPLQKEFEAAFEWEPTPDQLRAAADAKRDMESPRPMDRLVCGDVGFGKTEVAMRAAFKAVAAHKQVAVLVPTTLLAAQHFQSFVERFSGWPVQIELINRYRTPKEKASVLRRLAEGSVDVVVGTHALLSEKVKFRDLGLIVVDEEQKFGVRQKEKLRALRMQVDTMAMSATPIPRTLHLSLSGVRDISLIQTPPRNRLPVETRVVPFDPSAVVGEIRREIERGGQAFFVTPRIADLERLAEIVELGLPEARVAVAHGQMDERALEQVMSAFTAGEFDVLVSTGIVESGIDIPSVNTIVVNDAHRFGVSQLYQLRGRVGRSSVQAHAMLLVPENAALTPEAERRLQAMEHFTDLGSGFQLAMRDLENRGAGNLLGVEQSGFIEEIGLETYLRLVQEAVAELKGDASLEPARSAKVEIAADAYVPEEYVSDGLQRIAVYQRVSRIATPAQADDLLAELEDRYGPVPAEARALVSVMTMRVCGGRLGFEEVEIRGTQLLCTWDRASEPGAKEIAAVLADCPRPARLLYRKPMQAMVDLSSATPSERVAEAASVLRELSGSAS